MDPHGPSANRNLTGGQRSLRLTLPISTALTMDESYVLGTHPVELERLQLQHQLWSSRAQAAWTRAGMTADQSVLDLGAGPGFAALDLARRVGPGGRVVALERSPSFVACARHLAVAEGLHQLEVRQHDLLVDPLPRQRFDVIWCRWVAMFLEDVPRLLDQLPASLRPGGQVLFHEYVHWHTFALHPHGPTTERFKEAVVQSFRQAGGDPDVNRRLPSWLAARGFRVEGLEALPLVGRCDSPAGRWLQSFIAVYSERLIELGLWTAADQQELQREIGVAQADAGSFWVGPLVLELRASLPG